MVILVFGGSGSGKSGFAEEKLLRFKSDKKQFYLATMIPASDPETVSRIARHRELRKDKNFETVEQPFSIEEAIGKIPEDSDVLLECLSNLAANEMFGRMEGFGEMPENGNPSGQGSFDAAKSAENRIQNGITKLMKHVSNLVIVSNSVFEDGVEYDAYTMKYIEVLGNLNAYLAAVSDEVWEVVCGIPIEVKNAARH